THTIFLDLSPALGLWPLVQQHLVAIDVELILGIGDVLPGIDEEFRALDRLLRRLPPARALPLLDHDAQRTLSGILSNRRFVEFVECGRRRKNEILSRIAPPVAGGPSSHSSTRLRAFANPHRRGPWNGPVDF